MMRQMPNKVIYKKYLYKEIENQKFRKHIKYYLLEFECRGDFALE